MSFDRQAEIILCVDDEPMILVVLLHELRKQFGNEFIYESAASGDEGLLTVSELIAGGAKIALILSDWMMPGMKGDEFLIKVHAKYPEIRSIMITGHAEVSDFERLKQEAGMHMVIPKPWDRTLLYEAIKFCCNKK